MPGGLLTNPPIRFPFRAPAALNLPTTLRECQCRVLNFHLDSSVSRQRSLQRFKLGTRPWECLFRAFHSFWINAFSFLTQSVFQFCPASSWTAQLWGSFPTEVGACAVSYLKKQPHPFSLPRIPKSQIHRDKGLRCCLHGSGNRHYVFIPKGWSTEEIWVSVDHMRSGAQWALLNGGRRSPVFCFLCVVFFSTRAYTDCCLPLSHLLFLLLLKHEKVERCKGNLWSKQWL